MRSSLLHPHTLILLAIGLGKLILEMAVLRDGFISLTADEYSRTFDAASWADNPEFMTHGHWLPFHYYVLGTGLLFYWDLFMTPRAITLGFSLISLLALYNVSKRLFDPHTALITVVLVAANPWHVWLSATPLSEMPYIASIVTSMAFLIVYDQEQRDGALWAAAASLAFANGLRYESWFFSAAFSALLLIDSARHAFRSSNRPLFAGTRLLILALVWAFPAMWLLGNYLHSGDALYSFHATAAYHARSHGNVRHLGYMEMFMAIAPIMFPLSILGILLCLARREWSRLWPYLSMTAIVLFVFVVVTFPTPGGGRAITANPTRYFTIFYVLLAPYGAYLIRCTPAIAPHRRRTTAIAFICTAMVGLLIFNVSRAFHYSNGMSTDALETGRELRRLWTASPLGANQSTLLEVKYWDFLAVQVGSNDPSRLEFDRPLDKRTEGRSVLFGALPDVICHLQRQQFMYVVTASEEASQIFERTLRAERTIGRYRIYDPHPMYGRVACQRVS